jgi:ribosomal protein S18 acetylase RimI-like enzyme
MAQTAIRHFESEDIPASRALWLQSEGVGLSAADEPGALRAFLVRNPGLSFVATQGSALAGTILCGHDGRRGLIHHLVVAQGQRRHDLGRRLLHAGLGALREAGIQKCHLLVFRSNAAGLAFWRKVGADERTAVALFSISTENASQPFAPADLPRPAVRTRLS